jgi:hypothetical protein
MHLGNKFGAHELICIQVFLIISWFTHHPTLVIVGMIHLQKEKKKCQNTKKKKKTEEKKRNW